MIRGAKFRRDRRRAKRAATAHRALRGVPKRSDRAALARETLIEMGRLRRVEHPDRELYETIHRTRRNPKGQVGYPR